MLSMSFFFFFDFIIKRKELNITCDSPEWTFVVNFPIMYEIVPFEFVLPVKLSPTDFTVIRFLSSVY